MTRTRVVPRSTASVLAGLLLLAAACSSGDSDAGGGETASSAGEEDTAGEEDSAGDGAGAVSADPVTWSVDADGQLDVGDVTVYGFVPTDLRVRPGDTVEFVIQPGEAHTVTFGTLVDAALAAGPGGPAGPSPEFEALPDALTVDGEPVSTGLEPCYGDPPDDGSACASQEQPELRGDLALYGSGVLQPDSTFTVEIAEDIAPGDYGYLCLLHGFPMTGTLTVVGPGEDVPTPEEVEAAKDPVLQTLADAMEEPAATLAEGGLVPFFAENEIYPDGGAATVVTGTGGGPRAYFVELHQFGPAEVEVAAGETVRWHFQEPGHTISFNPPQDATPYLVTGDDGSWTVNPLAATEQGGATPIPPSAELLPDEPDGLPPAVVVDGGAWDGQGFFSSGIAPDFPPVSYDITFTEPGTYDYQCLVHPGMTGTVTVTD